MDSSWLPFAQLPNQSDSGAIARVDVYVPWMSVSVDCFYKFSTVFRVKSKPVRKDKERPVFLFLRNNVHIAEIGVFAAPSWPAHAKL